MVPLRQVKRWNSKEKKELFIVCPSAMASQRINLVGLEVLDCLSSYYYISAKSKTWYHCSVWSFLDVACIQAWLFTGKVLLPQILSLWNFWSPSYCYIDGKPKMGDHQDYPLTQVTQQRLKKEQVDRNLIGQFVLMAAFFGLNFPKQNAVNKIFVKLKCTECDVKLSFTTNFKCFKTFHK